MPTPQEIHDHLTWLGYLQPDGLVVSPAALVDSGLLFDRNTRPLHQEFLNHLRDEQAWDGAGDPTLRDLPAFLKNFLRWPAEAFVPADDQPAELSVVLPEYQETLRATWAIRNLHGGDPAYRLLVHELPPGLDFDAPVSDHARGWHAAPARRFERLLRETRVGTGLLSNGQALRLLYAPPGENPGSLTFRHAEMAQIAGRPILGGFHLLFEQYRLFTAPEKETLTALLKRSRDFQANVSTALSHQVLEALFELARGFQAADDRAHGTLLAETWQRDPQQIYGGLISTLLRLVFLLYAEDRGLMPQGELYLQNYSVQGLYDQLRADAERFPDTMDQRFGAWARLLALFRVTHAGSTHPEMKLPARQGHLFDPERFKFLEGRDQKPEARDQTSASGFPASSNQKSTIHNHQSSISSSHTSTFNVERSMFDVPSLPLLSDGTLHRILDLLLYLDGERLSYRTLDVEQIGSVYETIMGFEVQKAPGRMIALKPKKRHGAPVHLSLDSLLAAKPADREKTLLEQADTKLPPVAAKALKSAASEGDLLAALEKRIDRRATPHPVPAGSIILQPTDERRRSGSHYTSRSFTNPIVRKTLEPILDRLRGTSVPPAASSNQKSKINNPQSSISSSSSIHNPQSSIPPGEAADSPLITAHCSLGTSSPLGTPPLPEQILDLKIADIAIGSGAFQVEVCRQLADELVSSWHFHKCVPKIPVDEDEFLFARRLVAQRCLYGVDRNPMAVDLAKLSLWLATMARDHPFTFLDHSIKCGDSLVGLTNRQIAAFHWDLTAAKDRFIGQEKLEQQIAKVAALRKEILQDPEDTEFAVLRKQAKLAEADSAAKSLKTTGDLVIAAYFAGEKPKQRQQLRDEFLHRHLELQKGENIAENLPWQVQTLNHLKGISSSSSSPSSFILQPSSFPIRPFHWEIEFPEVFSRENPGFDAIVGNPPFLGGRRTSAALGNGFSEWLSTTTVESSNNADLSAFFFRRAFALLRQNGTLGLIATNTIGQGDTRQTGLAALRRQGGILYNVVKRLKWPGEAAVIVSVVNACKGEMVGKPFILDGTIVPIITSYLAASGTDATPVQLRENAELSFQGVIPLGIGFTFDDADGSGKATTLSEMRRLVSNEPNLAERIVPLIGGEEVLGSPTHDVSRYVIDFGEMSLDEAMRWPTLVQILQERALPDRINQKRAPLRERWWVFAETRPAMRKAIKGLPRILVHPFTSSHLAFAFLPSGILVAGPHQVFALPSDSSFTVLQCRVHEIWARFLASSLKDDLRYSAGDCFETFPFPPDWETNEAMEQAGRAYYEFRAALMIRNDEGLTKTYNRFHDPEEPSPDIRQLRELHAAMDRAVLDAYGWPDIPTACQFLLDYEDEEDSEEAGNASTISNPRSPIRRRRKKPWRYRWPDDIRDEVLARLLALNAERAQQERLSGTTGKKGTAKNATHLKQTIMQRPKAADELI